MVIIPNSVVWLITARCNLSCIHCYTSRFKGLGELSTNDALRLIQEIAEIGIRHVSISGGEPLIRKDLIQIIKELKNRNISCSIVTNGTLLNDYIANFLYHNDIFVYVSIDAPYREVHEKIRGRNTWKLLMKGIDILKHHGIDFATVMAINKVNVKHVENYVKYAENIGSLFACIIPVMPSGSAKSDIVLSKDEFIGAMRKVDKVANELGYEVDLWCSKPVELIVKSPYVRVYGCRTFNVIDISPSGDLLICDVLDFKVANILKVGLRCALEIYQNNDIVRKLVNPQLKPPCSNCRIRHTCKGGCFARAYLIKNDLFARDPYCPLNDF